MPSLSDMPSIGRDFAFALDPVLMAKAVGIAPDEKQAEFLRSTAPRALLCCTRQWGKSTFAGLAALHTAVYQGACSSPLSFTARSANF
jgi:hypothetical protein